MSQSLAQKNLWILVSSAGESTKDEDLARVAPNILSMIDEWVSSGKFIMSGPFGNESGGLAVFEGTEREAKEFSEHYGRICDGLITYQLYKWDVLWGSK